MILVLRPEVIEAMAEDLAHADPRTYEPVWKVKDPEYQSWHLDRKDPIKTVESFVRLVNKHNRGAHAHDDH